MSPIEWAIMSVVLGVTLVALWWALRGVRLGHEAAPTIEKLEEELDDANDKVKRLEASPLSPRAAIARLRRLLRS